ncbi:MAG: Alpha-1,3-mannosyltransferase-like protein [Geoglossum umbratile]|nr:MAG: Alpha-1,3-mannosyltransferase-like protein [Geoglossum umbratile]
MRNIVFLHPDLGIGGAERLVVDAAVGLQNLGHKVTIFTSHRDPKHCFDEARDGTLDVRVRGNSVFPPNIIGRFSILCAILRQLHLVLQIIFSGELAALKPEVFFIDQLSACIPLLRLFNRQARILFYCHFPDKLLATRKNLVKRLYRVPFDWLEAWTTGLADSLVVNSRFTASVFHEVFPGLRGRKPEVVYPCVNTMDTLARKTVGEKVEITDGEGFGIGGRKVILSINRFEKKKDVGLAIKAFAGLSDKEKGVARLVVAGGYDPRVQENVAYHKDLVSLSESLGLKAATTNNFITSLSVPTDINVLFLLSIPASLKSSLLHAAMLLVYTPSHEHFGIVPLEAMLAGTPALAASNGGPLETILDGKTGWLRSPTAVNEWTAVMHHVLSGCSAEDLQEMARAGRKHVEREFSERRMAERLDGEIEKMVKSPRRRAFRAEDVGGIMVGLGISVGVAAWGAVRFWSG